MKDEDLAHNFELFFTRWDETSRAGLSLSISYSLVEKHKGKAEVGTSLGGACSLFGLKVSMGGFMSLVGRHRYGENSAYAQLVRN